MNTKIYTKKKPLVAALSVALLALSPQAMAAPAVPPKTQKVETTEKTKQDAIEANNKAQAALKQAEEIKKAAEKLTIRHKLPLNRKV